MKNNRTDKKSQQGNVLFLILIAVALFAALSYAVTQSSRTGGGDATREKARLDAAEILNHATAVQTGVGRLLIRGCQDVRLNFDNAYDGHLHDNPTAPADKSCDVFEPAGAGVSGKAPSREWSSDHKFYYTSSSSVTDMGTTCTATTCADLVMELRGVSPALCEQLNALNNYIVPVPNLPSDTQAGCPFTGTYDCSGSGTAQIVFATAPLRGKNSVCFNDTVHGLTFVHVIYAR